MQRLMHRALPLQDDLALIVDGIARLWTGVLLIFAELPAGAALRAGMAAREQHSDNDGRDDPYHGAPMRKQNPGDHTKIVILPHARVYFFSGRLMAL